MNTTNQKLIIKEIYELAKNRAIHPAGKFDNAGRWHPADLLENSVSSDIRQPSRAWPYSLMVHCRTRKFIKNFVENNSFNDLQKALFYYQYKC